MEPRVLSVIGPAFITLAEFKLYAKIDETADDTLIPLIIDAATGACERYTGLFFRKKQVEYETELAPFRWGQDTPPIKLPYGPMQTVQTVHRWKNGAWELLEASQYSYSGYSWLTVNLDYSFRLSEYAWTRRRQKVTYTAGYHTSATPAENHPLEPDLKLAVLLLAAEMYQNRQVTLAGTIVATLDVTHKTLLNPYRQRTLF